MEPKTSKRRTKAALNENRAVNLRLNGYKYREIAEQLGVTESGAYAMVKRVLDRTRENANEVADEIRDIDNERIETMIKAWLPVAVNPREITTKDGDTINAGPDPSAANVVIRLLERRAKLFGLDAPEKKDVTSGGEKLKGYAIVSPDDWD